MSTAEPAPTTPSLELVDEAHEEMPWYTVTEAAKVLGISRQEVNRRIQKGRFAAEDVRTMGLNNHYILRKTAVHSQALEPPRKSPGRPLGSIAKPQDPQRRKTGRRRWGDAPA